MSFLILMSSVFTQFINLLLTEAFSFFFLTFFAEARIQRNTHAQAECEKPPGRNKTAAASRVGPEGGSISAAEESKMEVAAGPS